MSTTIIPKKFADVTLENEKASLIEQINSIKKKKIDINHALDLARESLAPGWDSSPEKKNTIIGFHNDIAKCDHTLVALESKLDEVKDSLRLSPAERTEKHYQRLLHAKNANPDKEKVVELAEQFHEMEDYKDSKVLKQECVDLGKKLHYDDLVRLKKELDSSDQVNPEDYRLLAEEFRQGKGYADTAELARECDERYYELKERREEQERIEWERRQEQVRIERERIAEAQRSKCERFQKFKNYIAAGHSHTIGLKANGKVVAVGENRWGECNIRSLRNIVAVDAGGCYTVGLKADGTVIAMGSNNYGECNTGSWRDIVAIAAGYSHTVGLKADGTVVAVGNNEHGQCNTGSWRNIVAVAAGNSHTVGLKADGTVVAVGRNDDGQCNIESWRDIVAVAAGNPMSNSGFTIGLKADGTVLVTERYEMYVYGFRSWRDIVAIAAGYGSHIIGLKADGTVVAAGTNTSGECNTENWRDIVAVTAGWLFTVGLKADGTVVAVGNNIDGQCNTGSWQNIGPASNAQEGKTSESNTGCLIMFALLGTLLTSGICGLAFLATIAWKF